MRLLSFKHKLLLLFAVLAFLSGRSSTPEAGNCLDFIISVQSAQAADMPLCKVNFATLSKTSGAPGDVFEMIGEWEDMQGAKTAVINRGIGNRLEVLSWTRKAISVRIPQSLRPGAYKVGVYCNNPPHQQGSGFKDFRVTAPALDEVRNNKGSLPATEADVPQQQADRQETAANSQPKKQAANSAGGIVNTVMEMLSGLWAELESRTGLLNFFGVLALLFFLDYFFKPKIKADRRTVERPHAPD